MRAPLLIRRARGGARDVARVGELLRASGQRVGDALSAALNDDRWGVVLLAERAGVLEGAAVLRFLRAVGARDDDDAASALLDGVHAHDDDAREALRDAARAEVEARELPWHGAPPRVELRAEPERAPPAGEALRVTDEVALRFVPGSIAPPMVTRWNGASAFRARWRADLAREGWSVEGCVGAEDPEGDAMRFDRDSRALRELFLTRPGAVSSDPRRLDALRALEAERGALSLPAGDAPFSVPRARTALFDVSLDLYAALVDDLSDGALRLVAVTDALALLFCDGRYAGWCVRDPVSSLRPMGWPDAREGAAPTRRDALTALVHDWMVIDASPRPRPDEVDDPDDIAHMVALRERARSLAAQGDPDDPTPGVARDVGAQVHWAWGFFRVPEG